MKKRMPDPDPEIEFELRKFELSIVATDRSAEMWFLLAVGVTLDLVIAGLPWPWNFPTAAEVGHLTLGAFAFVALFLYLKGRGRLLEEYRAVLREEKANRNRD